MEQHRLEKILIELKSLRPGVVCVNGHGETTLYPGWHLRCMEMIQGGLRLHLISNFARIFNSEELDALARFHCIEVSCDSHDPDLFAALRRGAQLETLLTNIRAVFDAARRLRLPGPHLTMSCVVCDKNVLSLPNFVRFALAHGVRGFNFCNLTTYPSTGSGLTAGHISEMPPSLLRAAEEGLQKALYILELEGVPYWVQQGLTDSLRDRIRALETAEPESKNQPGGIDAKRDRDARPVSETVGQHRFCRSEQVGELKTRDCLDPWSFMLAHADGAVSPCCWHPPLASISAGGTLSAILNGPAMRSLRSRLLNGDLPEYCRHCPVKGWTSIETLRRKATRYLYPLTLGVLFLHKPVTEPDVHELPVTFGDGWLSPEHDDAIPYPEWRNWRWSGQKGECFLYPGSHDAVLTITGGVNKNAVRDQKVIVRVNRETVDEFIPASAKFTREYVIWGKTASDNPEIKLEINTDKTFTPALCNPEASDFRELGVQLFQLKLTGYDPSG